MQIQNIFTQSVHAGERRSPSGFSPVVTPIYNSVIYLHDDARTLHEILAGDREGFVYSRNSNPTTDAFERAVAELEGGEGAVAFASGMAALHLALLGTGLRTGHKVVAARDLYGVTHALLAEVLAPLGVEKYSVDIANMADLERALEEHRPRVLIMESLSNPLLVVPDVPAIVDVAHRLGAMVVVDNTFATPYALKPLELGVDVVVHSVTKYLGGHDDVTGGVVVTGGKLLEETRRIAQTAGAVLGPSEASLAHRGLKTLALRMREHCANAAKVAEWLVRQRSVSRVYYPGLATHPQHETAKRLFRNGAFGGVVSFVLADNTEDAAIGVMQRLRLVLTATTLGSVRTLILLPARTSHRKLSPEQRAEWGISDGLLRLSVGIEHADDIIADLEAALGCA